MGLFVFALVLLLVSACRYCSRLRRATALKPSTPGRYRWAEAGRLGEQGMKEEPESNSSGPWTHRLHNLLFPRRFHSTYPRLIASYMLIVDQQGDENHGY
jgi:hypothetical protein